MPQPKKKVTISLPLRQYEFIEQDKDSDETVERYLERFLGQNLPWKGNDLGFIDDRLYFCQDCGNVQEGNARKCEKCGSKNLKVG